MNVIFNRPVKVGKVIYPKSKMSVDIDAKLLETPFMKALLEAGEISIPVSKAVPVAKASADKSAK